MKWLALALLLVNLLFFGWSYQFAPSHADDPIPAMADDLGAPLRLLKDGSPAARINGTAPVPVQSEAVPTCYRIGGFEKAGQRDSVAERLERAGATIVQRGSEEESESRFWVYLPPLPSQDAARPVVKKLEQHRFKDYYVVKSGENRHAISLGIFSDRQGADRRVARIRGYGFVPRVETVGFPVTRFSLSVRWPADTSFPGAADLGAASVEPATCRP